MEKGGRGFPYLVYMDAEGDVLGKPAGRDVASFERGAKTAQAYLDLKNKADRTPAEEAELLAAEIGLGKVSVAEAEKRMQGLELDEAGKQKIEAALTDLRILERVKSLRQGDMAGIAAAGKAYYEMYQAGQRPQGDEAFQAFYMLIMRYGQSEKDPDIFEVGLKAMKDKFGHLPQAARFFEAQEKALAELRKAKGQ
ncbi:MAG: hypothetical protein D6731_00405 [Planctomycetota bacterium]|nr:MAG: hypothetical protein D6731_00405 [Planctomycetota bacterium]